MTRDELIKRMAYAMHTSAAHSSFWSVEDLRTMAAAALADIEAQGMAIVPVEPTAGAIGAAWVILADAKASAGIARLGPGAGAADIWAAMIAAGRLA